MKNRSKIWLGILAVILGVSTVMFALDCKDMAGNVPVDISVSEIQLNGYVNDSGLYTNVVGDANIQLPEIDQYVAGIAVNLSSLSEENMNITVYYANEFHGYSEEYTASANVNRNNGSVYLFINEPITTCRIDIGTVEGEQFSIDSIVLNDNSFTSIKLFRATIPFLLFVFAAVTLYILLAVRPRIEKMFVAIALPLGCFYLITITPLSVPDEPHHYHSAYQLSNALLFQWDQMDYGSAADFDYSGFVGHKNVATGYIRILSEINEPETDSGLIEVPWPSSLSYFVEYLPQAIGISIARIMHANFIITFLLGRLCNLYFYTFCAFSAIKAAPKFKLLFFLLGIMPMALHQAASYSYDGFINGMAMLLTALLLKGIYEEGMLSHKDYFLILVIGTLLSPAKLVYWPILWLFGLIPHNRFRGIKDKCVRFGIVLLVSFCVLCIFQMSALISAQTASPLNWEGQTNYSVKFILENPVQTAKVFWTTFRLSFKTWFLCAIGAVMSGLTLGIPHWIIWSFALLLFLAVLNHEDSKYELSPYIRGAFLSVVLVIIFLIMLSMFIGWTSNTRSTIQGIQGRYFIPIFPLLFTSLNNQTLILRKRIDNVLVFSGVLLQCATIMEIVKYTIGV